MQKIYKNQMVVKVGSDIVYIPRIKEAINKFGLKFLNKILTNKETEYCTIKNIINYNSVAKRFAAKEAIVKALETGFGNDIGFKDVEIINKENKKPYFNISNKVSNFIINKLNIINYNIDVSLSDDKDYALATVVILGNNNENK